MIYMANPVNEETRAAQTAGEIGAIMTPAQGNLLPPGVKWCADNGVFGKGYPGDVGLLRWLAGYDEEQKSRCLFAVAPDVVGDAQATLDRSTPLMRRIRELGYPVAFVLQNGAERSGIPWDQLDVLFVGGCVECPDHGPTLEPIAVGTGGARRTYCPVCRVRIYEWKEQPPARAWIAEAKRRGKRVHMGRVNTGRRWRYAEHIGCDSVDGTMLTFGPAKNLADLRWFSRDHLFTDTTTF